VTHPWIKTRVKRRLTMHLDIHDLTKNYLVTFPVEGPGKIEELIAQPTLEQLRAAVGDGPIEVIPRFTKLAGRHCLAFCHEEGKLEGQPPNHVANVLWRIAAGPIDNDILVGSICVIVGAPDFLAEL
jgi:hypothetical protein